MILVFVLYGLLASTFTIGKMLLLFLPPLTLISLRMLVAGTIILAMHYATSKDSIRLKLFDFLMLFGFSSIHIFIPYATEFIALQNVAPSCAALMYNLSPFITALFSYIFFNEKMTLRKWIGFALGLTGILYFIKPDVWCLVHGNFEFEYGFLLLSVVSSCLGWVLVMYLIKQRNFSIMFLNGIAMLLGGLQAFVVSIYLGQAVFIYKPLLNSSFWMLFGLIIVIANIIFYNLYGYLLKRYTATFLSFAGFITPLFTAMYDLIFLGISIHADFFITVIIVGCGIYIFYQEELKQGYIAS